MDRNIFYTLLILTGTLSASKASTYLNEEAAKEGLTRGASEVFATSTGKLAMSYKDNTSTEANGVLIAPSLVLINRHTIKRVDQVQCGIFYAHPDPIEVLEKLKSPETPKSEKETLRKCVANFESANVYFHPDDNVDLAIVRLKTPIENVKPLPLLLTKPDKWTNGYFVSYAPVYSSPSSTEVFAKNKRHIAILSIKESTVSENTSLGIIKIPALLSYWQLEGDIWAQHNHQFIPQKEMHRLTAFTQLSDSGAGFIVSYEKKYQVAGIHHGRFILSDNAEGEQDYVSTNIIPLYPYKDWIEKILTM